MGCCRPPSPCPGHPDREACARKWPCALRRAVCELWQGRRGGIGRTRSRDGMAAPLSSKERVSQLVHGESRGEKGGVAGDPRRHSDNSKTQTDRHCYLERRLRLSRASAAQNRAVRIIREVAGTHRSSHRTIRPRAPLRSGAPRTTSRPPRPRSRAASVATMRRRQRHPLQKSKKT